MLKLDSLSRSHIVWLIAAAAAIETGAQATTSLMHHLRTDAAIWFCAAFLISIAAGFIETVKGRRSE